MRLNRRTLLTAAALAPAWPALSSSPEWARIEAAARGQKVFFNAWGGSEQINAYLQWAAGELRRAHGVQLEHVKLAETAEMVRRVRAEKAAGRSDGSADLVWINGENFLAMKRERLLHGPFAERLPSFALVDTVGKPTTLIDFSEPVDGMEAAWGMAQFTFYADSARVAQPPRDAAALLRWARANPGRFTYPRPPAFHGTTFLKQLLHDLAVERSPLYMPPAPQAFAVAAPALWAYLDELHPLLWRQGRQFPATAAQIRQMLADGELAIGLTFNPNEAANQIASGSLPKTVASFQWTGGTIGNTHFVAIPFNARSKEGAMVTANFLQSPLAQARKADIKVWGDPTVLALGRLSAADRELFVAATSAPGALRETAPAIPEPHASWVDPLEAEWRRRYGG